MKITKKIWLSETALNYVDLSDLDNPENNTWFYFSTSDMTDGGHTCVGEALIECKFHDRDVITGNTIVALKNRVQEIRADAENEITKLNEKIQQLLSITNEA
jgi:hypothetical protein